jgi:L-ascorbate metabolism protein UlaG (beta-lactamase superfamily)
LTLDRAPAGAPRRAGRFLNLVPIPAQGFRELLGIVWDSWTAKPPSTVPDRPVPVRPIAAAELAAAPDGSLYRLGHSTLLLKLDGGWFLTDPVFGERASPLSFAGPKRFHAPPLPLADLPPLRAVILSHDHYDHLDRDTVVALAAKAEVFVTPLGVGDRLAGWGVECRKLRQLDWWGATAIDNVRLTAVPARHFSGRTPWDRDRTLWTSWVIESDTARIFFSGDTGYHDGFKDIGARFGPFDVTLIENGGYDRRWPDVHMQPEQTLQAHLDLRGRWLLPIHNGTFDLAFHPWQEPLARLHALAAARGVDLATPGFGVRWSVDRPDAGSAWWRAGDADAAAPAPRSPAM